MRISGLARSLLLLITAGACQDKSLPPFVTDTETNHWINQQMQLWYYWDNKLPARPDYTLQPEAFFSSLLYRYDATARPDGDRFSWIQQSADELKSYLSGEAVTYGMEYRIITIPAIQKTLFNVLYVLPGSPADQAGIKRGDFFSEINGKPVTNANYASLLAGSTAKSFQAVRYNTETNQLEPLASVSVTPVKFQEDPAHYQEVKTIGTRKIGYLVYHSFFPSTNGTNDQKYDKKLESIFNDFKNKQVNELILDLRYNSGGYVTSAVQLASLIAKNVGNRPVFSIKEYNPEITAILKKRYGSDHFEDRFLVKPQNIGGQLEKIYVLTSRWTASASELLINGLLPYMPVVLVGTTTSGKNVGSVTLSDPKNRTNWGLQPIVSKSFNSLKKSDYSGGFHPDYEAIDGIQLYPYGDLRDPLLQKAIELITGTDQQSAARTSSEKGGNTWSFTENASSLSNHPADGSMFEILPEIGVIE
ncbi:S41 family peptidase [Ravibacter arvi]|uniref:S41 family peptidase n=1 Tax=Ravibacter arvi TaxID=2051041 RepID=A0ABP8LZA8_9BACT